MSKEVVQVETLGAAELKLVVALLLDFLELSLVKVDDFETYYMIEEKDTGQ